MATDSPVEHQEAAADRRCALCSKRSRSWVRHASVGLWHCLRCWAQGNKVSTGSTSSYRPGS